MAGRVARCKKAFTIAEEFILPSAIDMCREVIGAKAASKLELIPLSRDVAAAPQTPQLGGAQANFGGPS